MAFARAYSSGKNDDVATPAPLYAALDAELGPFDHDPCPLFGRARGLDSLAPGAEWGLCNYVNPPYSRVRPWIEKAIQLRDRRGARTVMLVPCCPNRKYWKELVLPQASEIRVLTNNVQFEGYSRALPMLLSVLVFDPAVPPPAGGREKGDVHLMKHVSLYSRKQQPSNAQQ